MQWKFTVALVTLTLFNALMAFSSFKSASLSQQISKNASFRSLAEISLEVADLRSLFELLQTQIRKLNGRSSTSGGRPPSNSAALSWKEAMRARMAANQMTGRHPAAGLTEEK